MISNKWLGSSSTWTSTLTRPFCICLYLLGAGPHSCVIVFLCDFVISKPLMFHWVPKVHHKNVLEPLCNVVCNLCGFVYNSCDFVYNLCNFVYNLCDFVYNLCDYVCNLCDFVCNLCDFVYILCSVQSEWLRVSTPWVFGISFDTILFKLYFIVFVCVDNLFIYLYICLFVCLFVFVLVVSWI